ncbi:MAG: hypothetical protein JWN85_3884 [Gammaproteobacteria bacterium]|nr:hypothetical protein [Gammaproteobacteria bacterium]
MTPDDTLAPRPAALEQPASVEISLHFFGGPREFAGHGYATVPLPEWCLVRNARRLNNTSNDGGRNMIVVPQESFRNRPPGS